MKPTQDPIVLEPKGFDCAAGWKSCKDEVDRCGGIVDEDGEPNWRAAFSADPGVCHCPKCKAYYWAWGTLIQCRECDFIFPTNAWSMYAWGTQQHGRPEELTSNPRWQKMHERRLAHPYYRFGFEHPTDNSWETYNNIQWGDIFKSGYKENDVFIDGAYRP